TVRKGGCSLQTVGKCIGGQPVFDGIGAADRLVQCAEGQNRRDRAEGLLMQDAGVGREVGHYRRREKVPVARQAFPAQLNRSAAALRVVDQFGRRRQASLVI